MRMTWRKNEMKFFNRITTRTQNSEKRNAVIMGRKTWFSIPKAHRPLPNRVNVVLSRSLQERPEGAHHLAHDFEEAIHWLTSPSRCEDVENIMVIGGSDVYKVAMDSPYCHKVYLTRVLQDFDCDTFFPMFDESQYELISDPDVPGEIQEENGIPYKFHVYQKKQQH
ncbi:PREDICTED: dihydrofolate reductase-like isoform X2 [Priapulus caudatus]|uniref:dihydrofolate reductase n=1 Tax=Priapulus caudatus TaxID=37621 RepID=A0ABM1EG32_PRICU|nr:PREDICTED: dihydrofolate reductase-like isoform X2 [Priapulus caudatus]